MTIEKNKHQRCPSCLSYATMAVVTESIEQDELLESRTCNACKAKFINVFRFHNQWLVNVGEATNDRS